MPAFNPTDTALQSWKHQVDTALRIAEAFVEGAEKAREIQLGAAVDAHAWLEASRQALTGEIGPGELIALQSRVATENLGKMAEYWSRLGANARDTQARIMTILTEGAMPQGAVPQDALNALVDAGYKQWIEALKRLYVPVASKN